MRQLTKDPNAAAKARAAEQRANEEAGLKSINLSSVSTSTPASVKKKPVFKSTLQPHNVAAIAQITSKPMDVLDEDDDPSGAVGGGWYEERYRPSSPTKCTHDPKCESDITSEDLRQLVLEWRALEKGGDLNRLDGLRPLERGVDSNLLDRGVSLKPFEGDVIMKDS